MYLTKRVSKIGDKPLPGQTYRNPVKHISVTRLECVNWHFTCFVRYEQSFRGHATSNGEFSIMTTQLSLNTEPEMSFLMKYSSFSALKIAILTNSGASDENFLQNDDISVSVNDKPQVVQMAWHRLENTRTHYRRQAICPCQWRMCASLGQDK